MLSTKSIELEEAKVFLREDGIVCAIIRDGTEMNEERALKVIDAIGELSNGKKVLHMVDSGQNTSFDSSFRSCVADVSKNQYCSHIAVVLNAFYQKLTANFFMNFNKPQMPTKFFDNQEDAIAWLKEQKD